MKVLINGLVLLSFVLLIIMFNGCLNTNKEQVNLHLIFDDVTSLHCVTGGDNGNDSFSNLQFFRREFILNDKRYRMLNPINAMNLEGFLRREKQVIYLLPNMSSGVEQKLFDFNAHSGEAWEVKYSDQRVEKITFVTSEYNQSLDDTFFVYRLAKVRSPYPEPSHALKLTYVQLGKKRGIVNCYYAAYNGYIVRQFYPDCKKYQMSYKASMILDSMWKG